MNPLPSGTLTRLTISSAFRIAYLPIKFCMVGSYPSNSRRHHTIRRNSPLSWLLCHATVTPIDKGKFFSILIATQNPILTAVLFQWGGNSAFAMNAPFTLLPSFTNILYHILLLLSSIFVNFFEKIFFFFIVIKLNVLHFFGRKISFHIVFV